jgi:GxxExxY protein
LADDELNSGDPQTFAIIGACMAVHNELGPGFLESVYQEALAIEFSRRGIPFVAELPIPIDYCGVRLVTHFHADFICYGEIIVELKAISGLTNAHYAIIINYLKATNCARGLLVNFGTERLEYKRFVLSLHLRKSATSADNSGELSTDDADGRR